MTTDMSGHIIAWENSRDVWSTVVNECVADPVSVVWSHPHQFYLPSSVLPLFDSPLQFVILPLTLPRFNSIRIAEHAHRTQAETNIVLISDTNCPRRTLRRLFDSHLVNSELTQPLLQQALRRKTTRKRDGVQIRAAIDAILSDASCFRVQPYGVRHPAPRQATVRDYDDPTQVWTSPEWHEILGKLRDIAEAIRDAAPDDDTKKGLEHLYDALMRANASIDDPDRTNRVLRMAKWAIETATKLGVNVASAALRKALGVN